MRMNLATVTRYDHNSSKEQQELFMSLTKHFSESYGISHKDMMLIMMEGPKILDEFVRWMKVDCGFTTVRPWKLPKQYKIHNYGFDMEDDDPGYIKWKLSVS